MIPIGEVDGKITPRIQMVGQILASMPGFGVDIRSDMDAWLKTHVALLMPSLAPAGAWGTALQAMVRKKLLFEVEGSTDAR